MTRVLTVNPGSSSLKLAVVDGDEVTERRTVDRWDGSVDPLAEFTKRVGIDVAAVRIVHGGDRRGPTRLTGAELAALAVFSDLAPLHQPAGLRLATAAAGLLPDVPLFGCYDTSFHSGLPERARAVPVPAALARELGIRRHGFHGLSVAYAVRRAARLLGRAVDELRLVVAHIGSGVSITAVDRGRSADTSMGYSPLEGVPGNTRSGSLDPEVVLALLRAGRGPTEVDDLLTRRSGLAGLSGSDGDVHTLLAARARGDAPARTALAVYTHRIAREIAAARVSLDGLDALVFTGGVAEHNPGLRAEVLAALHHLGLADGDAEFAADDEVVTAPPAAAVLTIRAREELEMARQVHDPAMASAGDRRTS
ncbi:acetate kinase [Actinokineospora sp. NBRC 105648]|nr:acetate kinase [Actinokineospora sp. NBRC 105648]